MSANLNINPKTNEAAVMVVKESAWHRQGVVLPEAATAEEALKHGGLDYQVTKTPIFTQVDGAVQTSDRHFGTVRTDTNSILGVVGPKYAVIQNSEAFSFFDAIVADEKAAIYHSAGALGLGETMWLQAKMPEHIRVGKNDVTEVYVTLTNSHDGSGALKAYITPIRVVCNNTLRASLKSNSGVVSIRHTVNFDDKLKQAHQLLDIENLYRKEMQQALNAMHRVKLSTTGIDDFVAAMMPAMLTADGDYKINTRLENKRSELVEVIHTGIGQDINKGSNYWLYNGYTRFLENQDYNGKNNIEVYQLLNGDMHIKRQKAFEFLMPSKN